MEWARGRVAMMACDSPLYEMVWNLLRGHVTIVPFDSEGSKAKWSGRVPLLW